MFVIPKLFYFVMLFVTSESARILAVFPMPLVSHQVVFRPLMQELAKRGHELVVITTDAVLSSQHLPNLTVIDLHDLSNIIKDDFLATGKVQGHYTPERAKMVLETISIIFEAQVKSKLVQDLINDKNKRFDLIFTEACVRPALIFGYKFKVPIIEFSSMAGVIGTLDGTGAPTNPLIYPLPMRKRIYNLNLWEKISELYINYSFDKVFKETEKSENEMLRRIFGPNIPDLTDLRKNVQMIFLNVNPIWDFNRPVPPNIIYLGGIHLQSTQKLPKELKSYLDSSKNGVIYISFGTNARMSLLPKEKIQIFTNVFSRLSYDILWKWDEDYIQELSTNVKISKWVPQADLLSIYCHYLAALGHPNVRLFITQGGLQSIDEAITAEVPVIVTPFLSDQWFNAEQCDKFKIGIHLEIEFITEDILMSAIETVIKNTTYRENVVNLHKLMSDQPQSSLERAVWWTEYVLRHGDAKHLQAAGADLEWGEYYALDLITLILMSTLTILLGIAFVVRLIFTKLRYKTLIIKTTRKKCN